MRMTSSWEILRFAQNDMDREILNACCYCPINYSMFIGYSLIFMRLWDFL